MSRASVDKREALLAAELYREGPATVDEWRAMARRLENAIHALLEGDVAGPQVAGRVLCDLAALRRRPTIAPNRVAE